MVMLHFSMPAFSTESKSKDPTVSALPTSDSLGKALLRSDNKKLESDAAIALESDPNKKEITPQDDIIKETPMAPATSTPVAAHSGTDLKTDHAVLSLTSASEGMQKRWNALFSKEITPGSIAYTVKSGDNLYTIAIKNHTTVTLIKKLNELKSDDIYPHMQLKIYTAPFLIVIDKSENTLTLFSQGESLKKYSVATGKKNSTPTGEFKIINKLVHPTWFKTGAILPPGSPKNALGTRWMGFDKPAYGIHGTIDSQSIGTQASEGCIRMLNEDVEELYSIVPMGTQVTVQD